MKDYKEEFEKANMVLLDLFGGSDNATYVRYLFTMRDIAEKANDGLCETDRDICNVVIKMARLIDAIRV